MKYTALDVFQLLGIPVPGRKVEVEVICPYCGSRHFAMNMAKSTGHCWKCNGTASPVTYYAVHRGISFEEALEELNERLNNNNGNKDVIPPRVVYKEPEDTPLAPIEIRDKTYRAFLDELHLSEKNFNMLLARGFNKETIEVLNYKTFPSRTHTDFFALCRRLQSDGHRLEGVPGFFRAKTGDWTFVALTPGIIMPSVDIHNRIAFLQIRKDDDLRTFNEEKGGLESKCSWFSSSGLPGGTKAYAEVHFACDKMFNGESGKWWPTESETYALTEGIMKGDLAHDLLPKMPVITIAGVRNYKVLSDTLMQLKGLGVKKILLCLDMDYRFNKNVKSAIEVITQIIKDAGLECIFRVWETKVQVDMKRYDLLNGIDDYLAYVTKGIVPEIKEL